MHGSTHHDQYTVRTGTRKLCLCKEPLRLQNGNPPLLQKSIVHSTDVSTILQYVFSGLGKIYCSEMRMRMKWNEIAIARLIGRDDRSTPGKILAGGRSGISFRGKVGLLWADIISPNNSRQAVFRLKIVRPHAVRSQDELSSQFITPGLGPRDDRLLLPERTLLWL